MRYSSLIVIACGVLIACSPRGPEEPAGPVAEDLAHRIIVVDTHVDVPYRLEKSEAPIDISRRTQEGDFDYPRAREGGLDVPFMSIYVPASYQETGGARELADSLIDMVEGFASRWPDKFAITRSPEEARRNFERGVISLPMGMENGAPIESDLDNIGHFHERGIRYITLTHSENNQICDSSYADETTWNGLSPFGAKVVEEMNRVGVMVDVSHISDDALADVIETTKAPVIASHSSCRRFTPGWERNLDDDGIRLVASTGGVVQINFGSAFIHEEAHKQSDAYWEEVERYREENGLEDGVEEDDERVQAFREEYWKNHERIYADLSDVVDNIDHVVELVGVDHVGFGSDFDGVGDSLPTGLKDVSGYPNLIRALLERGYSEEDVRKIAGENLLRVWSDVERVARELSPETAP